MSEFWRTQFARCQRDFEKLTQPVSITLTQALGKKDVIRSAHGMLYGRPIPLKPVPQPSLHALPNPAQSQYPPPILRCIDFGTITNPTGQFLTTADSMAVASFCGTHSSPNPLIDNPNPAHEAFKKAADEAGRILSSVSGTFCPRVIPEETMDAHSDWARWIYALFDVCWYGAKDGLPDAARNVYISNVGGGHGWSASLSVENIRQHWENPKLMPLLGVKMDREWADGPHDWTAIIGDAASTSVRVIDWLLANGKAAAKPERPIQSAHDLADWLRWLGSDVRTHYTGLEHCRRGGDLILQALKASAFDGGDLVPLREILLGRDDRYDLIVNADPSETDERKAFTKTLYWLGESHDEIMPNLSGTALLEWMADELERRGQSQRKDSSPTTLAAEVNHRPASVIPSSELTDSEECFIEALKQAGKRMTGEDLCVKALGKHNSHGKALLAGLVKRLVLDNRRDDTPHGKGYGLPEWSRD